MLSSFARETLTRLRYPKTTDHGVDVPDYTANPTEDDSAGWWLEPIESQEVIDGRLAVLTGYLVAGPADADFVAEDRARYRGVVYEVIGEVMHVPSPTGALASTRFRIQIWNG